jgi:MEMO1 family protein
MGRISIFLGVVAMALFTSLSVRDISASGTDNVREPAAAGSFYPDDADELRAMISKLLDAVPDEPSGGEVIAAMAPHAGYVYSGAVAARTLKKLAGCDFDTIVIIGHDTGVKNYVAFLSPADYFKTPLGLVEVDRAMTEKMIQFNKGIISYASAHSDHSVEIQLPFLQVMGKRCKIVPVIFGDPTAKNCKILADAIIAGAGKKKVFVLSSTDMAHYPSYEDEERIGLATLELVKTMDVDKLFNYLTAQDKGGTVSNLETAMCSRGGLGTVIYFAKARGADKAQVLMHANSGDVSFGKKSSVVGYGSVIFVKTGSK